MTAVHEARWQYATELACSHGHYGGDPGGICCSICRPLLEAWDAEHPESVEDWAEGADPAPDSVRVGKKRRRSRGFNISDAALSGYDGSGEFNTLAHALGAVSQDSDGPIVGPKKIV